MSDFINQIEEKNKTFAIKMLHARNSLLRLFIAKYFCLFIFDRNYLSKASMFFGSTISMNERESRQTV